MKNVSANLADIIMNVFKKLCKATSPLLRDFEIDLFREICCKNPEELDHRGHYGVHPSAHEIDLP